jgi:hypothetical protein
MRQRAPPCQYREKCQEQAIISEAHAKEWSFTGKSKKGQLGRLVPWLGRLPLRLMTSHSEPAVLI